MAAPVHYANGHFYVFIDGNKSYIASLDNVYTKSDVYTKTEANNAFIEQAPLGNMHIQGTISSGDSNSCTPVRWDSGGFYVTLDGTKNYFNHHT